MECSTAKAAAGHVERLVRLELPDEHDKIEAKVRWSWRNQVADDAARRG
jgi:hypothetical protein